jgi:N-acetylglucosamine-6-phosphate deacetylase
VIILSDHIFNEEAGRFTAGEIHIDGERFVSQASGEKLDYNGCYVLPGFIDIHVHGGFGRAFMESAPGDIDEIAAYFASAGVTAFCPTTVSGEEKACMRGMDEIVRCKAFLGGEGFQGARVAGIYQEGPFLSPEKPGAADAAHFRKPDREFFRRLQTHARKKGIAIQFVAIAPELEGAVDFIREFSPPVVCTLAHSTADYAAAKKAIENGSIQITHLFNAMPPLLHREPGIIGAAFDSPAVRAELIADGEHVHPSAVRAAFQLFTGERIVLISDSLFSGLPDGSYKTEGLSITLKNGVARSGQGALAGSSKTLGDCVINAVKNIGIPLYQAAKCASVNPAKQAGIFHERGGISPGKYADLVIMNKDYTIRDVIVRGTLLGRT